MNQYYFFLQPTDKDGAVAGVARNLEQDFSGLLYSQCDGLEAEGEVKNIYKEDYAEQDGPRVYHPTDIDGGVVTRKETAVKLTLLFVGAGRRGIYSSFLAFARSGRLYYWDTARHRKAWLLLEKQVEPDMDYLGDEGCIKAEFEFTNLWGCTKLCNDSGTLL